MDARIETEQLTPQDATVANLNKIASTKAKLSTLKSSLNLVLDNVQENPSLIQRAASNWKESSTVEKIAKVGFTTMPGIATPILKSAGLLLLPGYGVGALVALTVGSITYHIILDDYNEKSSEARLKESLLSVGDLLGLVIGELDVISQNLTEQVNLFKSENLRLTSNVDNLEREIDDFTGQINTFKTNNEFLTKQTSELEKQLLALKQDSAQNAELIKLQEQMLADFSLDQKKNQLALDNKMRELEVVKQTMGLELEKARKVSSMLQNTVQMLSKTSIKNEADRETFKQKMDDLLTKGETDLKAVNERILNMEEQFETLLNELQQSNQLYKELLRKEEEQLSFLERLTAPTTEARSFLSSLNFFKQPFNLNILANTENNNIRSTNTP